MEIHNMKLVSCNKKFFSSHSPSFCVALCIQCIGKMLDSCPGTLNFLQSSSATEFHFQVIELLNLCGLGWSNLSLVKCAQSNTSEVIGGRFLLKGDLYRIIFGCWVEDNFKEKIVVLSLFAPRPNLFLCCFWILKNLFISEAAVRQKKCRDKSPLSQFKHS